MKLSDKENDALMELAGTRKAIITLLDNGVRKLEEDLLSASPEAALLLEKKLKLEGAKALRAHLSALMRPTDR